MQSHIHLWAGGIRTSSGVEPGSLSADNDRYAETTFMSLWAPPEPDPLSGVVKSESHVAASHSECVHWPTTSHRGDVFYDVTVKLSSGFAGGP